MSKKIVALIIRVVLYARVSTEEQGTDDHHSLDAQLNEMRDYAAQKGWTVVGEFVETVSGTKRDRPQLDAVLALARAREFDILLVHELSRLSRSVYHTLDIFDILGKHSIGFASVKDPDFDFADPTKRFFLIILAAINEYYIGLLRMHTSKAKRQRARSGLYNASITPFGYALSGDPQQPPVVVPDEAPIVLLAYEKYATGQYSVFELMELLGDAGYRNRKGERFPKDTLAAMLQNPFYMGKVVYRGERGQSDEVFDGLHAAIVPEDLWERCQRVRASRRSASRAVQKPYRVYLLSNLAYCDICGRKLRSQASAKGPQYYREMSYERGYTDCPQHSLGVRTDVVDPQIHAIINTIQLPDDWRQELPHYLDDDDEVYELQRRRQSLEAERRRLKLAYLRGDFPDDEDDELYKSELARVRRELDSLPTADQMENIGAAADTIRSLHDVWPDSDPTDQRDLLRILLREVRVDVATGRVVSLSPQAVFIPLFRQVPMLIEREFGVFVPIWPIEQAAAVFSIDPPRPIAPPLDRGVALPFVIDDPRDIDPGARIAPMLSQALIKCREAGVKPEMVVQIISDERWPLPADLRKWPLAASEELPLDDVLARPNESVDVLATSMLLWDHVINVDTPRDGEQLIRQLHAVMSKGGVWYLAEVLPAEMAGHWVYTYFPEAWDWAHKRTRTLHELYQQVQGVGFKAEVRRSRHYAPITLGAALDLAATLSGPLVRVSERALEQGLAKLRSAIEAQGKDHAIGSEVVLVEMWAQKAVV